MVVPLLTWSEGPRIRPRCCVTWPELGVVAGGMGRSRAWELAALGCWAKPSLLGTFAVPN